MQISPHAGAICFQAHHAEVDSHRPKHTHTHTHTHTHAHTHTHTHTHTPEPIIQTFARPCLSQY